MRGDRDDVFSHGYLCPKGTAIKQLEADPDRLRRPMVREGASWREVDWPEAFAAVDEGLTRVLDAHGPDAVALYLGNPSVHSLGLGSYIRVLAQALGTTKVFSASTVDQMPKQVAAGLMFGALLTIPVPDVDRTDHLLMLGANPYASNGSLFTAPDLPGRLKALRARGGRLVVVDPRRTKTAEEADEHLPDPARHRRAVPVRARAHALRRGARRPRPGRAAPRGGRRRRATRDATSRRRSSRPAAGSTRPRSGGPPASSRPPSEPRCTAASARA